MVGADKALRSVHADVIGRRMVVKKKMDVVEIYAEVEVEVAVEFEIGRRSLVLRTQRFVMCRYDECQKTRVCQYANAR